MADEGARRDKGSDHPAADTARECISRLKMTNFKNFEDEALHVGPFTVIAGANASGKSNIRDAFRLLHGIGRGYSLADILGGKYGHGGQVEWHPIRGALNEITRFGNGGFSLEVFFGELIPLLELPGRESIYRNTRYNLTAEESEVGPTGFRVKRERLGTIPDVYTYTSHPGANDPVGNQNDDNHLLIRMAKAEKQRKYGFRIAARPDQPALTQIAEHGKIRREHKRIAKDVAQTLADMRFLDLSPEHMRNPSFPGQTVLGDSGENLPTVLKAIWEDPRLQQTLRDWLRELTPMDVADFEFPSDSTSGRIQLVIVEANGRRVSGYAASDGTLRFLAMLAALLGPNRPGLHYFEEIDNGIHPSRLHLLVELIEQQTAGGDIQVITTTHSPQLLSMLSDESFKCASVVCRDEDSTDAVIRLIHELPNAEELRRSQGLDRLHASGWFEDAIGFTEEREET